MSPRIRHVRLDGVKDRYFTVWASKILRPVNISITQHGIACSTRREVGVDVLKRKHKFRHINNDLNRKTNQKCSHTLPTARDRPNSRGERHKTHNPHLWNYLDGGQRKLRRKTLSFNVGKLFTSRSPVHGVQKNGSYLYSRSSRQ
jgi:hypothetical protein